MKVVGKSIVTSSSIKIQFLYLNQSSNIENVEILCVAYVFEVNKSSVCKDESVGILVDPDEIQSDRISFLRSG